MSANSSRSATARRMTLMSNAPRFALGQLVATTTDCQQPLRTIGLQSKFEVGEAPLPLMHLRRISAPPVHCLGDAPLLAHNKRA